MRVSLERRVATSPDVMFALVSVPELMNLWSQARIDLVDPGDGHHPAGVGAIRSVQLPGRLGVRLLEVIEESDPGRRLVYRVFRGAGVRRHQGRMELAADGSGTRFRWNVELELAASAVEPFVRRSLLPQLETSVDALVAVAAMTERAPPPPPRRTLPADPAALRERAEACLAEQVALADAMTTAGDARRWFTRVYEHVTRLQLAACDAGEYAHPGWVLRLVERFHHYYTRNLDHPLASRPARLESHWQSAFRRMRAAQDRSGGDRFRELGSGVFHGMRAHIEDDLPRALADVYVAAYAGACDYVRFRADYLRMDGVFRGATSATLAAVDRSEWPLAHRILQRLPREARDEFLARRMYDIGRARRQAFERGGRIAEQILGTPALRAG